MGNRIHMRAVQRAAEIVGGVMPLARSLDVPPLLVYAWSEGTHDVPAEAFLRMVEILLEAEYAVCGPIAESERESFRYRAAANS